MDLSHETIFNDGLQEERGIENKGAEAYLIRFLEVRTQQTGNGTGNGTVIS